jgi:poly(A) polymerase
VGASFGVVVVTLGDHTYEVARFRRDVGHSDGRHPDEVAFSNEEEDALRRDFTVNGMFYDPIQDRVIDYVGGRDDLDRKVIRTIGSPERRFREDRLRMMRAVRFASRLGWDIAPETFAAVRRFSSHIGEVSRERVRDELVKILTEGGGAMGVRWLVDLGLMQGIAPEVLEMDGVAQPPAFHPEGDVLIHVLTMLGLMCDPSPELAMGVLLHDIAKPRTLTWNDRIRFDGHDRLGAEMAGEICRRLRFSAGQARHIAELVAHHHQFMHVQQMRPSRLKRFLRTERFEDHLELHRIDCLGSHGNLENHEFCRRALAELGAEDIRPERLITGHDLVRLGYPPGPLYTRVLSAVEDAQLEGVVQDRASALSLARETFSRLGVPDPGPRARGDSGREADKEG